MPSSPSIPNWRRNKKKRLERASLFIGFTESLIEDRPRQEGRHRPVEPDEENDDGTDGTIDDGIVPHIVYIMGEKEGICHPCRCGKEGSGEDISPAGTLIGAEGINRGGQQNKGKGQGQKTDLIPKGDEFHGDGQELRHEGKQPFPDNQQNKHGGDKNKDDKIQEKDLQQMLFAGELIVLIDICHFFGHIFHGAERKPQGKGQTEGEDGAVGIGRHMDKGDI